MIVYVFSLNYAPRFIQHGNSKNQKQGGFDFFNTLRDLSFCGLKKYRKIKNRGGFNTKISNNFLSFPVVDNYMYAHIYIPL
jgi:hypothetical protein